MRLILVFLLFLCGMQLFAQGDSANLDALQKQADLMQRQYEAMWRASDSLRISSIITRMKSDSLYRYIKAQRKQLAMLAKAKADSIRTSANDTLMVTQEMKQNMSVEINDADTTNEILQSMALALAARKAEALARNSKPKRGQTLSDSITYAVLSFRPDTGIASYYAGDFHGKKTSNGEIFNMNQPTCAHRWLPFGTLLHVTNLDNGKEVVVKVTDRGPFKHGRIIDVSKGAAVTLGMIRSGTARVRIAIHTLTEADGEAQDAKVAQPDSVLIPSAP